MELYNIYCGFWEGMKEISVRGVPKWLYMIGNLKNKVDCSKRPSEKKIEKKNGLEKKKLKKEKR